MDNKYKLDKVNLLGIIFSLLLFGPLITSLLLIYIGFIYEYDKTLISIIFSTFIYHIFGLTGLFFMKMTILGTLGYILSSIGTDEKLDKLRENKKIVKNIDYIYMLKNKNNIINNYRKIVYNKFDKCYVYLDNKYPTFDKNICLIYDKYIFLKKKILYIVNNIHDDIIIIHNCIYNSKYKPYIIISDIFYLGCSLINIIILLLKTQKILNNNLNNNLFGMCSNINNISYEEKQKMSNNLDFMMANMFKTLKNTNSSVNNRKSNMFKELYNVD